MSLDRCSAQCIFIGGAYHCRSNYDFDLWLMFAESTGMFNFRRIEKEMDTSLFDPEHDMDLVALINEARTEREIQSVARMSRARMRSRRHQLAAARRPHQPDSTQARGFSPPSSLLRGF